MPKKKIRIDYTVYAPDHPAGGVCWDFRTIRTAMAAARRLGIGSRIYRNFNQEYKQGKIPGNWWSSKFFWTWTGNSFIRKIDPKIKQLRITDPTCSA